MYIYIYVYHVSVLTTMAGAAPGRGIHAIGHLRHHPRRPVSRPPAAISQKVFMKSFGKSLFSHKSVNVSFMKNKLTYLCGS
jgi:hypothetical protein